MFTIGVLCQDCLLGGKKEAYEWKIIQNLALFQQQDHVI